MRKFRAQTATELPQEPTRIGDFISAQAINQQNQPEAQAVNPPQPPVTDNANANANQLPYPCLVTLLTPIFYMSFNRPDLEVFDPTILFEISREEDVKVFYAIQRSPSRFQERCDVMFVDMNSEALIRLINPKKNANKLKVLSGDTMIGSIIKPGYSPCNPSFKLRDKEKREFGIIRSRRECCHCLLLQKLKCTSSAGVYDVIKTKDVHGKLLKEPLHLASILRDVSDFSNKKAQVGVLEIQFQNLPEVDVNVKALCCAAAIFIDFQVFGGQNSHMSLKVIIILGVLIFVMVILIIYGITELIKYVHDGHNK